MMRRLKGMSAIAGSFVTLACYGLAPYAGAATATGTGDGASSGGLEEVVVTAQKRSENSKDVPIAVTAVSADEISSANIQNYDDLTRAVPGMSFGSAGNGAGTGQTNIEIRGVSSTAGSATVGTYIDEVSVTVKNFYDGATQPRLFDLDHLEVLRGPQGTLYGASSMGGTIRFVTKQPDLTTFSGELDAGLSKTSRTDNFNYESSAVVNLPIIPDKLAVRASLAYNYDAGWINNSSPFTGQLQDRGTNTEKDLTAHINVLMVPDDTLTIKPSLFVQQNKMGDSPAFYIPGVPLQAYIPGQAPSPINPNLPVTSGLWNQSKEIQEPDTDRVVLPSLTVDKDFSFADLTSVSAFFKRDVDRWQDGTPYNSAAFAIFFLDALGTGVPINQQANDSIIAFLPSPVHYQTDYGQVSQEFRLATKPDQTVMNIPVKAVGGLYYADQWSTFKVTQVIDNINSAFQSIYGSPLSGVGPVQTALANFIGVTAPYNFFPGGSDEFEYHYYNEKDYAAFAQLDAELIPRLHATLGLRYTMARESYDFYSYGFYEIGNYTYQNPLSEVSNYRAFTPKYGLSYDISDQSNVYASATKGYRLGGPNSPVPIGSCQAAGDFALYSIPNPPPNNFASDSLWSYEVGNKSRLFDNRLSVDTDFFYVDWKNIQQSIFMVGCGYPITLNAGDAVSYGPEIELHYKLTDGLKIGFSGSIDHTEITRSNFPTTIQVGDRILNTPNWMANLSAEYKHPITEDWLAFARVDYTFTGNSSGTYINNQANYEDPSYDVLNASIGVDAGPWELSVYGKNLTYDRIIINQPQVNEVVEGYTVRPMTVGMRAKFRF
jgi:outer membrane receptor protein involved in Fe transport